VTDEPVDEEAVDGWQVLETLASLPVSSWRYKWEPPGIRHLGPMAQDFKAAFDLGDDDKTIANVDANGVSMVAIQALYRRVTALEEEVAELRRAADQPATPDER
jgi:Chaperone of endosialidase